MNEETPNPDALKTVLVSEFKVSPDNLDRVIRALQENRLATVAELRDAIGWYNSPISPGFSHPITTFPEDEICLQKIVSDLVASRLKGVTLFDEPDGDFND